MSAIDEKIVALKGVHILSFFTLVESLDYLEYETVLFCLRS